MGTSSPGRTLAMLFTDIEGSTVLLQRLGDRYDALLIEHRAHIREAIAGSNGREVGTEGDSFFALFDSAPDAVSAAVAAQRALTSSDASDDERIRVRMGVHVGEVRFIGDDPVGLAVHQASRIMSAAHGEQIVVSEPVRALCADLDGITFTDLGEHRLKDLLAPQRLMQVAHPELPAEFPPLRTLASRRNNLPIELTSFVGREDVLAEVTGLLQRSRLVTLTGAGGVGKTRLALQVAADVLNDYPAGAWLIDLAPLTDPALVVATMANVLGIRSEPGAPAEEGLIEHLRPRTALLLLDNCEHLIDACASMADQLLRGCPDVRIIATSREPLRLDGEVAIRVPSLGVDGADDDAVLLFAERAIAADPSFVLSEEVLEDVRRICRRLDGIALAIELAAARVRAMSPRQIAERVEDRFRLLTGGSRTAMARQRTLRATVDWSYDLLDEDERLLLRRLSVFAGGFALEDAEAVCGEDLDVFDPLLRLLDRSLVVGEPRGDEVRYRMLETIRQYAGEKLADAGDSARMRDRHAAWVVAMAIDAEPLLEGREQRMWLDRMEEQLDNIRAAMQWRLDVPDGAEDAAEIAASLWRLWWVRGLWAEGIRWLEAAYPRVPDRTRLRGRVAWALGFLLDFAGSWARAAELAEEALSVALEVGDRRLECYACFLRVFAGERDGKQEKEGEIRETLAIARELDDPQASAWCLLILGVAVGQTDHELALSLTEDARALAVAAGDDWSRGMAVNNLSSYAAAAGDLGRARELAEESIALRRELRDMFGVAQSTYNLGVFEYVAGDVARARAGLEEAVRLHDELGDGRGAGMARVLLAMLAVLQGDVDLAERYVESAIAAVEREEPGRTLGMARMIRGVIDHARGALDGARERLTEVRELARRLEMPDLEADAEMLLACVDADAGDAPGAETRVRALIDPSAAGPSVSDPSSIAETLAYISVRAGRRDVAAVLLGAVGADPRRRVRWNVAYPDLREVARELQAEHPQAWARGSGLDVAQAVTDALGGADVRASDLGGSVDG